MLLGCVGLDSKKLDFPSLKTNYPQLSEIENPWHRFSIQRETK